MGSPILFRVTFLTVVALAACSTKEEPAATPIDDAGRAGDDAPTIRDASEPESDDAQGFDTVTTPEAPVSNDASLTNFDAIIAGYRSWQRPAKSPEAVSAYIFTICRAPTLREQAFAKSEHGNQLYLLDWTNSLAAQAVARKGVPGFEPGAAIVKEKLVRSADGGFDLVALGIMVKREPGFDVANGDWDYGYWEKSAGIVHSPAQTAHCGGCHAGVQDTDYVFMDAMTWLTNP
jgi:hypothetical protein